MCLVSKKGLSTADHREPLRGAEMPLHQVSHSQPESVSLSDEKRGFSNLLLLWDCSSTEAQIAAYQ